MGLDALGLLAAFEIARFTFIPRGILIDPFFEFQRGKANLRIIESEEIRPVPYAPVSHPFVERLIGTIGREYLDHVPG